MLSSLYWEHRTSVRTGLTVCDLKRVQNLVSSLKWRSSFNILHVLSSLPGILLTCVGEAGRFVPCLSCGEVIVNNNFWKIRRKCAFHQKIANCALSTIGRGFLLLRCFCLFFSGCFTADELCAALYWLHRRIIRSVAKRFWHLMV